MIINQKTQIVKFSPLHRWCVTATLVSLLSACGGEDNNTTHVPSLNGDIQATPHKPALPSDSALTVVQQVLQAQHSLLANRASYLETLLLTDGLHTKTVNLGAIIGYTVDLVAPIGQYAYTQTIGCNGGGMVSLEPFLANPENGLMPGDYAQVRFENCTDPQGVSLTGGVTAIFSFVLGELRVSPQYSFTADIEFSDLQISDSANFNALITGDLSLTQYVSSSTVTQDIINNWVEISGGQQLQMNAIDTARTIERERNQFVSEAAGRLATGRLNHAVTYDTSIPFEGGINQPPVSGAMEVLTADNQKITFSILENNKVAIRREDRQTGITEEAISVDWATLLNTSSGPY